MLFRSGTIESFGNDSIVPNFVNRSDSEQAIVLAFLGSLRSGCGFGPVRSRSLCCCGGSHDPSVVGRGFLCTRIGVGDHGDRFRGSVALHLEVFAGGFRSWYSQLLLTLVRPVALVLLAGGDIASWCWFSLTWADGRISG